MILIIDNYDSFTENLARYGRELGHEVVVRQNDEIDIDWVQAQPCQHIILSPGPGRPEDAGITPEVVSQCQHSHAILGVCLGHQAIAHAYGATVVAAQRIMHGRVSAITHHGHPLFAEIRSPFNATRYHSLAVAMDTLPDCLRVLAITDDEDKEIMAIGHTEQPIFGVQFHPESLTTEFGHQLLTNFLAVRPHNYPMFTRSSANCRGANA